MSASTVSTDWKFSQTSISKILYKRQRFDVGASSHFMRASLLGIIKLVYYH